MSKRKDAWIRPLNDVNICSLCKYDCKEDGDTSECMFFYPSEEAWIEMKHREINHL